MTDERTLNAQDAQAVPSTAEFHYIKSPSFHVTHVDGVIGSVTPSGHIHMAMFSERPAIPLRIVQSIKQDGTLGDEVSSTGRTGFVREIDVDVVMGLDAAIALKNWITRQIDSLQDIRQGNKS